MGTTAVVGLLAAGTIAGVVGSAGGITSMVSFPALLAVGIAPLPAAVVNNVALVACWPGSALASTPELRGRAPWLVRWLVVAAAGGAAGSVLLRTASTATFDRLVPFLVALGSTALLVEPHLRPRRQRAGDPTVGAGVLCFAVYNGFFGAGAGILTLTWMLRFVEPHLPTANALKNMLIGAASVASAAVLVAGAPVRWAAVAPLAAGMLLGSSIGPRVARRLPTQTLRAAIVLLGFTLAAGLAWEAYG